MDWMQDELGKASSQQINETVQKALKDVPFPVSKQDLVRLAQQKNVPGPLVDKIRSMPGDQYSGPQDVIKAIQQQQ